MSPAFKQSKFVPPESINDIPLVVKNSLKSSYKIPDGKVLIAKRFRRHRTDEFGANGHAIFYQVAAYSNGHCGYRRDIRVSRWHSGKSRIGVDIRLMRALKKAAQYI